ncbi:hypothetical protein AMELA_G00136110 [Ameiurus melas]|uniref:Uncharacterized protein n=1 Tax=Ameiurus melas TaxID=219545 RepID=A0A7J6AK81_AMEME|nr:hypothetical protein AMELA_G00136110 [Ameiurus melas]
MKDISNQWRRPNTYFITGPHQNLSSDSLKVDSAHYTLISQQFHKAAQERARGGETLTTLTAAIIAE